MLKCLPQKKDVYLALQSGTAPWYENKDFWPFHPLKSVLWSSSNTIMLSRKEPNKKDIGKNRMSFKGAIIHYTLNIDA